jgi:NitT/TauT family transport system ATP-binding protein
LDRHLNVLETSAAGRSGGASATDAPCIALEGVGVAYGRDNNRIDALVDINLTVGEGQFVALLGPTGCGKSTLLRVISDLTAPTTGRVTVRDKPAARARHANEFGFVFQEPALMPWRTALDNVNLPLEIVDYPPAERRARCEDLLASIGLSKFKNSYPHQLSGGMKQRVAIVRALAWNPSILLMDEPFSALDELTKNQLQDDLLSLWSTEGKTILFVTHNISEAVYLADRIVVMSAHPGRVAAEIDVELPRPRRPEMRETMEFLDHVRRARKALAGPPVRHSGAEPTGPARSGRPDDRLREEPGIHTPSTGIMNSGIAARGAPE